MISMKPHLQGIIKSNDRSSFGQEDQSSLGPFIAGIVLGAVGSIFAMTLAIKTKPLSQKQLQEKFSRYAAEKWSKDHVVPGHSPHKTVLMRTY